MARGFIGGLCTEKRKGSGADWPLAKRAQARWLTMHGCAINGSKKGKETGERRKEDDGVRAADKRASSAVKGKRGGVQ